MKKKLIQNVEMPADAEVNFKILDDNLKRRGCKNNDILYIEELIHNNRIYDFSGYSGTTTILTKDVTNEGKGYCIKICDEPKKLKRNYVMLNLFNRYGIAPKVFKFISDNKDYLIMERINSPMANNVFCNYKDLARFMGKSLRKFHDINWKSKSFTIEEEKMIKEKTESIIPIALSHSKGLEFLAAYEENKDYNSMKKYLVDNMRNYIPDVIIHGDFNPRNVFVDKNCELKAIIDLEDTCWGDRHYDIYFSMWTVALYSGISQNRNEVQKCEKIFLDSYGREKIVMQRMNYCKKLACMYWQESNDINGLI